MSVISSNVDCESVLAVDLRKVRREPIAHPALPVQFVSRRSDPPTAPPGSCATRVNSLANRNAIFKASVSS